MMPDIQTSEYESPFPEQSRLEDIVQDLIAQAQQLGADEVEAGVSIDAGLSVTVRLGETETLEYNRDRALGLTVYLSLAATVRAACDIARYTSRDEYAGLADADRIATSIPDLDLYHPWDISAEQAIELAAGCEDAARQVDRRIENSEGGTVSTNTGMRVKAHTHGFMAGYRSSYYSLSCAVIGKQGEEMQRDYWSWSARDYADLPPAAEVGRIAGERTIRRLGTQHLSTRQVPVIYAADIASSLFAGIYSYP
jgi:PmbA protein